MVPDQRAAHFFEDVDTTLVNAVRGYRAAMIRTGEMMAARSATRHVPAIGIARMFAHAGDTEQAMSWLSAFEARESPLARLKFPR